MGEKAEFCRTMQLKRKSVIEPIINDMEEEGNVGVL
jgi:hypothetical protein